MVFTGGAPVEVSLTAPADGSILALGTSVTVAADVSGEGVTIDLDGNARSGDFDIGCYESTG